MKNNKFRKRLCGLTAQEIFEGKYRGMGLKFNQLLGANQHLNFSPDSVCLDTYLTPKISLKIPLVSSPMDTVTTARMAIGMADSGGIGIVHANFESFQQKREVGKVKSGFIMNPLVLSREMRLEFYEFVRGKYSHVPITEDGAPNGKFLGMIPKYFRPRPHHETMQDCLEDESVHCEVTVLKNEILDEKEVVNSEKALNLMAQRNTTALAVLEENGCLFGLIIASDLRASRAASPQATLDGKGRRRVGAAITPFPEDYERRVPILVESGVDVLCIDTAHGDSEYVGKAIQWIKDRERYPEVEVIAGNVSTADGAKFLAECGADAIRAGNGPGGSCATHEVTHMGAESAVGLYRVAQGLRGSHPHVEVIADGGIKSPGDMFIALALRAHTVMCGTYLAPLGESAAPLRSVLENGKKVLRKMHRGMASESAMKERVVARYGAEQIRMPEGEEIPLEPEQRPLAEFVALQMAGVRQAFAYAGVRSIPELHKKVRSGEITFDVSL